MTPEQAAAERGHLHLVEGGSPSGRVPAHNLDAEAAVLSAVLVDPAALPPLAGYLHPADFFSRDNRSIFAAALELRKRGKPVDVVTIMAELRANDRGHLVRYVAQITDATPAVANVGEHARIVLDCSRWRALAEEMHQALAVCYDPPPDTEGALAAIVTSVHRAARRGAPRCAHRLGKAAMAALDRPMGISWGITALDRAIGPLIPPWLYIIMAKPGNGKTALAAWAALKVAIEGWGVAFFSADIDNSLLAPRMVCALGHAACCAEVVSYETFGGNDRMPSAEELAIYTDLSALLDGLPLRVDDGKRPTPAHIETACLQIADDLAREKRDNPGVAHRGQLKVIVIDHARRMGLVPIDPKNPPTEAQRLTDTAYELSQMSKRLGVACILLSQLSEDGKGNPYPYGSKGMAQEADAVGAIEIQGSQMNFDCTSKHCKRRAGMASNGCWHWDGGTQSFYD
jgi:replicative DNA helicase